MRTLGKYRGHWPILMFLLWLLLSLTTAMSPPDEKRPIEPPEKIQRPPLVLGSSIVSQKTIALMRLYTKYSALTYCPKEMLTDFSCKLCQEDEELSGTAHLKVFNESIFGMQAFTAVNHYQKTIILAVRGRANEINTLSTLKVKHMYPFQRSPFTRGVLAHMGFSQSYFHIRSMIVKRLKTLVKMYPKYELVFTGHSMGGAVASMAAIDALYPNGYLRPLISPGRVSVITVGQPRLGNKPFTRLFNSVGFKRVLRAVNYTDPVPHLPGMILGYRHSLRQIFLDEFGVARFCNDPNTGGEDTNCAGLITHKFYNTTYHKWYFGVGLGIYSDCYYTDS